MIMDRMPRPRTRRARLLERVEYAAGMKSRETLGWVVVETSSSHLAFAEARAPSSTGHASTIGGGCRPTRTRTLGATAAVTRIARCKFANSVC